MKCRSKKYLGTIYLKPCALSLRGETKAAIALLSQLVEEAQTTDSQFLATFLINRGKNIFELLQG